MKKEIEAFVNAANEQELEAAWNNLCLLYTSLRAGTSGLRRPHHSGGNHDGLDHGTAGNDAVIV